MLKLVQYVSRKSCSVVQPTCSWRNLLISPNNSVEKCITQRRHFLFCLTNRTTSSSSFALYCGEQPQQFQKSRCCKESTVSSRTLLSSQQIQRAFHLSSTRLETSKAVDEALAARKQTSTSNNRRKSLFIDPDDHTEGIKIEGIM